MNENFLAALIMLIYFSPIFYQLVIVIKESKKGNKIPLKKLIAFIKYSFAILLPIALGFGIISHTNYFNYEKPITFDKINQITFENFRGIELFRKSLYGNEHFAYVVTTIESDFDGDFLIVQTLFHPSRSFVYNSHTNSKELLTHEKYHIKIAELFTRKIKKRLTEHEALTNDKIEEVIKQAKFEERAFQKKYDYDTFHSYVLSEQKKYEKEVDSLLNLLTDFKNPKIKVYGKN